MSFNMTLDELFSLLDAILPLVIRFLDQFPHALDVIVSCARKTEVALWDHLFSSVGKPEDLFEVSHPACLVKHSLTDFALVLVMLGRWKVTHRHLVSDHPSNHATHDNWWQGYHPATP